ncbi:hypothetical protein HAX54_025574 [Datura stramonium]|uniref:Uncharacterized protein n=1 Tax=Datura stramonium TaxID=4076 RepID=A0ABS8S6D3_DATST|nr:hypothetical protein [Datura stramonium]
MAKHVKMMDGAKKGKAQMDTSRNKKSGKVGVRNGGLLNLDKASLWDLGTQCRLFHCTSSSFGPDFLALVPPWLNTSKYRRYTESINLDKKESQPCGDGDGNVQYLLCT